MDTLTMVPCPSCGLDGEISLCGKYMIDGMSMIDSRMSEEDARRLVASVNHLKEFSVEELESPGRHVTLSRNPLAGLSGVT